MKTMMNDFVLYSIDVEPYTEEMIDILCNENENAKYAFSGESCIWSTHEKELRDFSKKHRDYLFSLYGQGDEAPDIWIKYFMNGKMQYCPANITFDEFDKKKLK